MPGFTPAHARCGAHPWRGRAQPRRAVIARGGRCATVPSGRPRERERARARADAL